MSNLFPIETDDQIEALAKVCGIDNRRYMTKQDYAIWCQTMRKLIALATGGLRMTIAVADLNEGEVVLYGELLYGVVRRNKNSKPQDACLISSEVARDRYLLANYGVREKAFHPFVGTIWASRYDWVYNKVDARLATHEEIQLVANRFRDGGVDPVALGIKVDPVAAELESWWVRAGGFT